VLRRTSQAALNRFSRNRASTVSGGPPTFEAKKEQPINEYGSHVVDVLDVIGKLSDRLGDEVATTAITANNMTMLIRPGDLSPIDPYQCAELTVHSQSGRFHQSHAHLSIVEGTSVRRRAGNVHGRRRVLGGEAKGGPAGLGAVASLLKHVIRASGSAVCRSTRRP
jgi:hypothetical protein